MKLHGRPFFSKTSEQLIAGCSKWPSARPQPPNAPEAYPLGYVEDAFKARTTLAAFFSILLRAMHVLRQELLNPSAHLVEPLSCLEIRKEIGQVAPHSLAVPIHHGQIGSDVRREIDLVDHQEIGSGDSRTTFAWNLITGCHI